MNSEPTPGRTRVEIWRRGDETVHVPVDADGIIRCSAEVVAQLLAQAGWERVS